LGGNIGIARVKILTYGKLMVQDQEIYQLIRKLKYVGIQMYVISAEELFIWLLLFLKYIP